MVERAADAGLMPQALAQQPVNIGERNTGSRHLDVDVLAPVDIERVLSAERGGAGVNCSELVGHEPGQLLTADLAVREVRRHCEPFDYQAVIARGAPDHVDE